MTRMSFTIKNDADRQSASELVRTLKDGMRVDIKMAKRSDPQNAKFWAMLGEVAEQVIWHGEKLPPEDWKYLFMDAYKREIRLIPAIEGKGFVAIGRSSSDLTVAEMADVITLIEMFGANHSVKFKENHESNSPDAQQEPPLRDLVDAPAATGPHTIKAAGVSYSFKEPGWFDHYLGFLTAVRDVPASLMTRHQTALKSAVDEPLNQVQHQIMSSAIRLVKARNEAALRKGEWDQRTSDLRRQAQSSITATKGAAA
ncbi:MAG: hypothetical protein NVS3B5_01540 [Sphingomicrobium sp.]